MTKQFENIYTLAVEDLQTVANSEIERDLTSDEIIKISSIVSSRIKWYDIISVAIYEVIEDKS
jgi:hypothetical protein